MKPRKRPPADEMQGRLSPQEQRIRDKMPARRRGRPRGKPLALELPAWITT